ncbi:DUF58 domain-containing protein [Dactylosporangium aurantiacum]|uniref:DUF58 domain-containing protein n=1 Tax=Dactylosporangium aurantiacum TaxID=35754 RepID=A0A9Q9MCE7_9ACTN|nr:DUF58 domain-containing protein [Dactylosporangium aurantiacum]MDG6108381.1 DUF58 domain-containing protein [Dactylosporangium aurantiacum]UWZ53918.1 DUF58 domain-containing protein [Dactylosporangium aurantiacum]
MITWRPAAAVAAGTLLLALAGVALGDRVGGAWLWLGAAALLTAVAAACALDAVAAVPPKALTLTRSGQRSLWLGDTGTVELTVRNGAGRPFTGRVRDAWVPSAGAHPTEQDVRIGPGRTVRLTTTLTPTRRGDRPAVRVTLRSYGPLRLAYRQTTRRAADAMTPPWQLRVYPAFASRRILPEKVARLRVLDGSVVTRGRGQGTEFDTLREYVIGDDVRSIDWRGSARRSDVVVRSWRPERDRRLVCVLDTGRTSAARIGDEPRLDAAMDAALLLASVAARADDRVDLLAVDTAVRASVTNVDKSTLLWRLVTAMAPLQPALVETDFGLVAGEILRRERKRALVVLFTALEPGALGDGLLPVLPQLAARHKVVVAAVHDPELSRMAQVPPDAAAEEVYAAAAAQRTLAERERVSAALRRHGVEVVDAPADVFASRVTDHYLALKATGRL